MNLAEPAKPVAPATADEAPTVTSIRNDSEYTVEPAVEAESSIVTPAPKVEPAVLYDDARKFAPADKLRESHTKGVFTITPGELKDSGCAFAGAAALSRGEKATFLRRTLPSCLFDRGFISYGEAARYVVLKDCNCFVFAEESDANPLYNIPLGSLQPVKENPKNPHKRSVTISPSVNTNMTGNDFETILLLDAMGDLAYQFTFDVSQDKDLAVRFILAVQNINVTNKASDVGKTQVSKVDTTTSKTSMV